MKVLAAVIVAAALGCAGIAQAQQAKGTEGTYFGANFSSVSYKEDGFPTVKPTAIGIKFGREFNRNLAVEARIGFGAGSDTVVFLGIPVEVEVDYYVGVFGKGILPLSDIFSLYGLLGFTTGEITASAFGTSFSESDSDVSFGMGADLWLSRNAALNFEWAKLFEGSGYKVEALSLGFTYKF